MEVLEKVAIRTRAQTRAMTIDDVAFELGVSPRAAESIIADPARRFPESFNVGAGKIRKSRRWDREAFNQWVADQGKGVA